MFVIEGGGYGHGIGMSQNGANEMAKGGNDYKEILNMFYSDIMVKYDVHSCTDITGFGLLGHSFEMAQGSECTIHLNVDNLKMIYNFKNKKLHYRRNRWCDFFIILQMLMYML